MIQEITKKFYSFLELLFGGKAYSNGRKMTITLVVILLLFICAIFVPDSKVFLTDSIFMGALVGVVVSYLTGNVVQKFVKKE